METISMRLEKRRQRSNRGGIDGADIQRWRRQVEAEIDRGQTLSNRGSYDTVVGQAHTHDDELPSQSSHTTTRTQRTGIAGDDHDHRDAPQRHVHYGPPREPRYHAHWLEYESNA
ncbi:hypothetical protein VTO42DRAFT_473 [Malbranchea cinnamomea]